MTEHATDIEWLRRYTEHASEEAFATLARRYVDLVYPTARRRMGEQTMTEEVTRGRPRRALAAVLREQDSARNWRRASRERRDGTEAGFMIILVKGSRILRLSVEHKEANQRSQLGGNAAIASSLGGNTLLPSRNTEASYFVFGRRTGKCSEKQTIPIQSIIRGPRFQSCVWIHEAGSGKKKP